MTAGWIPGLLTGLALIVAIGAQNAFVLRQGIRRNHVWTVLLICIGSDLALIFLGTAGIGVLIDRVPWLLEVFRWGGVAYLTGFAVRSFRSALKTQTLQAGEQSGGTLRSVALTAFAIAWLNPHAYLDVLMLGNLANQQGDQRWMFTAGAMAASVVWFLSLGAGAKALSRGLNTPLTWRIVDVAVGLVMLGIATKLVLTPAV